ncbi:MAG TPA: AI-2E family transporter [Gemmatimonadales bacterium]
MTVLSKTLSEERSWLTTISLMVLAAVAGAVALGYTRPVMVPFVLAIFLYYLVSPIADFLEFRAKLPRWASVVITFLIVAALLGVLGLLITTSASGLIDSVPIYRDKLVNLAQRIFAVLDKYGIDLGQGNVLSSLQQLPLGTLVRGAAGTVFGLVSNGFLVLVFVIFLLIGRRQDTVRTGIYKEMDQKIRSFIVTKFATSAVTGTLVGLILGIFGLDLALVFGVLAFLLNFVPSIGSVIATLLPLPIALVQYESGWMVVAVIAVPGAVQMVVGNGIEPKIMGEGLDLSPITILLALVFWGLLWGVAGMLLATPITAVLRIVMLRFETTRPLAELLAGRFLTTRAPVDLPPTVSRAWPVR